MNTPGLKQIELPMDYKLIRPANRRQIFHGPSMRSFEEAEYRTRTGLAGHNEAVRWIFDTIATNACRGATPLGVFLLVGPSGIGKSELAKLMGGVNTDPGDELIKEALHCEFDLSTCKHPSDISSIIGAAPGFAGYDERGSIFFRKLEAMAKTIREYDGDPDWKPFGVVCLEHVDKAHPEALNVLMSLLSAGELSNSSNVKISVPNLVVLMTAGWESSRITQMVIKGTPYSELVRKAKDLIGLAVRPSDRQRLLSADVLNKCTVLPMMEPQPSELLAHIGVMLSAHLARNLAGMSASALGRFRPCAELLSDIWNELTRRHIPQTNVRSTLEAAEDVLKRFVIDPRDIKRALTKPDDGMIYEVFQQTDSSCLRITATGLQQHQQGKIKASFPLALLERHGLPVSREDYWSEMQNAGERIKGIVKGQDKVVDDLVKRMRARIREGYGSCPLWSALCVGPTGSGKTALAKALARECGKELAFYDCNTWQSEAQLWEGIFSDSQDSVVSRVQSSPDTIFLFDEVDKAHPKLWQYLMTVLDTGTIRDQDTGKEATLRHAVVMMTSNYLAKELGVVAKENAEKTIEEIDARVRTELSRAADINEACLERMDRIYLMLPLEGKNAYGLWNKFIEERLSAIPCAAGVTQIDPRIATHLESVHLARNAGAGARARRRTLDGFIADWLAEDRENTIFVVRGNSFELKEGCSPRA
jgi:ATP-dependent Clp protease ATP-binding subunit ClpA